MGLETIKMRDLEGKAENIYESVAIMAKRARHINNIRLSKKEAILDGHDETEEYITEPIEPIVTERETKVTSDALEEFLEGKIEYEYVEPMPIMEEDESTESSESEDTEEKSKDK